MEVTKKGFILTNIIALFVAFYDWYNNDIIWILDSILLIDFNIFLLSVVFMSYILNPKNHDKK